MTLRQTRRGTVIPLLAICVIALFGFVALAIDLGMMMVARTECQNAADAGALAAARTLDNKVPAGMNPDLYDNQKPAALVNATTAIKSNYFLSSQFTDPRIESLVISLYDYDTTSQQFQFINPAPPVKPTGKAWSAVEVIVNGDQPTYFGRVLGINSMPMNARAVAVHRPRDVSMVLDMTGSMGYGSTFTYNNVYNSGDPTYPQFGHYTRYLAYQTGNPNNSQTDGNPAVRPNPLHQTGTVVAAPYVYSPGNFTITTQNGFAIIKDFLYDPNQAANDNVTSSTLPNAFHALGFAETRTIAGGVLSFGPTPAPDNFKIQSDAPTGFVGDRWPRKRGHVPTLPDAGTTSWNVTTATGSAVTAAEYLGWVANYVSGTTLPTTMLPATPTGRTTDWLNFRDATWERHGYDLDVAHYVTNRGTDWDPRFDWDASAGTGMPPSGGWVHERNADPTSTFRPQLKPVDQRFKGYTMGPGYWGKTFFVWPPDPRTSNDWRRKFFLDRSGNNFNTQGTVTDVDADTTTTGNQTINGEVLTNGTGRTLRDASGNWTANYSAILAWIKSGPQVFPPNLRSGRVKYYTAIPDDVNTNTGSSERIADKRFWRAYIDYVLVGAGSTLAGVENVGWPEGVTPSVFATGTLNQYDVDGAGSKPPDARPYMRYTDNPSRPRMHMWFGPVTMLGFIQSIGMISGTSHEAQCWQLKAGVNSALDDIRANHPNDLIGMSFFTVDGSNPNNSPRSYKSIMVHMGQDWTNLKNCLFFPRSLLPQMSDITKEIRPYDDAMSYTGWADIPNAQSNTDPNTGLSLGFNMLAPSSYVNADPNRRGRRGASKIVIFETDGIPNSSQRFQFNAFGYESYYSYVGGNDSLGPAGAAFAVVEQTVKPMALTNTSGLDSGMSLPNNTARVYAIGFGDIFSTSAGPAAASFLLDIQKKGKTSLLTDTAMPPAHIITGTYDVRINNLRTALERIMQSGVQVSLVE